MTTQTQNFETTRYQDNGGFVRRFKVSLSNPRDFKVGDRYIVIGSSKKPQEITTETQAKKVNESITSDIRRFLD